MMEILAYLVVVTGISYGVIPAAMEKEHTRLAVNCLTVTLAVQAAVIYHCRIQEWSPSFLPVCFFCLAQAMVINQVLLTVEMNKAWPVVRCLPEWLTGGCVALVITGFVWGLADLVVSGAGVVSISE